MFRGLARKDAVGESVSSRFASWNLGKVGLSAETPIALPSLRFSGFCIEIHIHFFRLHCYWKPIRKWHLRRTLTDI